MGGKKKRKSSKYLSLFELRRDISLCATISSSFDYLHEQPRHSDWPPDPETYYGDEWCGWDFLVQDTKATYTRLFFPPLGELLCFLREHPEIDSREKYIAYCREHFFGPLDPEAFYADEWPGWDELFEIARKVRTFQEGSDALMHLLCTTDRPATFSSAHIARKRQMMKQRQKNKKILGGT